MTSYKKIEIITNSVELPAMERLFEQLRIPGYSVIPGVTGSGHRGRVSGDEMTGIFTNVYILVAVPSSQMEALLSAVQPKIQKYGGICLVSDVEYLEHTNR
ncbi:MAG: P-II family nitrogen regulator [Candidatus Methylacidiphilales bacterium]